MSEKGRGSNPSALFNGKEVTVYIVTVKMEYQRRKIWCILVRLMEIKYVPCGKESHGLLGKAYFQRHRSDCGR